MRALSRKIQIGQFSGKVLSKIYTVVSPTDVIDEEFTSISG